MTQSLVEIFKNADAAAKLVANATEGRAMAYDSMLDGVAQFFTGGEFDATKAGEKIAAAWLSARGEKIPAPTKSEMLIAAEAGAKGVYNQAAAAWKDWTAHCAGEKRATGSRYQTVRDLLRYHLAGGATNDAGDTVAFDLDAGGIYDMLEFKSASRAKPTLTALANNFADLNAMCGGIFTEASSIQDITAKVKAMFPKAFETKKATKKEKARPHVVVTVVPAAAAPTPQTIPAPVTTTESVAPLDIPALDPLEIAKMLASSDKKMRAEGQRRLAALNVK